MSDNLQHRNSHQSAAGIAFRSDLARTEFLSDPLGHQKFVGNSQIASLGPNKLEITELPVRTWTNNYMEDIEKLMVGDEKIGPAQVQEYWYRNTDNIIRMIVQMDPAKLR